MSFIQDLIDEAKAWALIGGKPSDKEPRVRSNLIEFLELVSMADFKFRYTPGDPKTKGVELRHEILKNHIARLKNAELLHTCQHKIEGFKCPECFPKARDGFSVCKHGAEGFTCKECFPEVAR